MPRTEVVRRLTWVWLAVCGCSTATAPPAEPTDVDASSSAGVAETSLDPSPESSSSDTADPGPDAAPGRTADDRRFVVHGATVYGVGPIDVLVQDGRIAHLGPPGDPEFVGITVVDRTGDHLVPAFIDSHVHLSYAFDAPTLAAGGVAAVVDLAAPIESLAQSPAPLRWLGAGPMITATDGYPTQGWGAGGYGLEVAGVDEVRAAVDRLVDAGAGVIKVPIGEDPALGDAELVALVTRAHERGRKVVAHALADAHAARAAIAGVDVLAHTPTEALAEATVQAWSTRAVISTLDAFGGAPATIDNLRRLREAGATVLYGTDLGNTGIPAIDPNEIDAMVAAGLSGDAIVAAATATPATFWGFEDAGTLAQGARASFIVVEADPAIDPPTLALPVAVYIDGVLQPPGWTAGTGIKG